MNFGDMTIWLFNQIDKYPAVGSLLILMTMDFFSGMLVAATKRQLSASKATQGVTKKVYTILLVGLAAVFEPHTGGMPITKIVAMFYCGTEGISIIRNAGRLGVPLPKALVEILEKVKSEAETTKVKITKTEVEVDMPSPPPEKDKETE